MSVERLCPLVVLQRNNHTDKRSHHGNAVNPVSFRHETTIHELFNQVINQLINHLISQQHFTDADSTTCPDNQFKVSQKVKIQSFTSVLIKILSDQYYIINL